ncbi:hypothetical protein Cgig2_015118 [Carnegiea gigantea]|uniref:T-complex protein 1 subunit gamma n=1 Tax=Carnegiea gigantea TaxID=171969 RepID=A0A9Q1KQ51_9CARY|nr:hypothetical protein Cgig2_015118 [Carnegiea gigantea]
MGLSITVSSENELEDMTGEMLHVAEEFIDKNYYPTVICRAYSKALEDAVAVLDKIAMSIDVKDCATMFGLVKSCIGTKFTSQFGDLVANLAIEATAMVGVDLGQGQREVDIKKYIKVEKVPGGQLEDSQKGENQTNAEIMREEDWEVLLKMEEEYIENMCAQILKFRPDLVITEKGLSDLACHYLSKAGVSAIRRARKTDNSRIAKACGAVIVSRPGELQESAVGTGAGLFEVEKIGDEFFAFIVDCKDPKACTVLLRGASKDLLIEWPYEAVAVAFEAIPRTLAQNCGANVIRTMTALRGKHANDENAWLGLDGNTGEIADMKEKKKSLIVAPKICHVQENKLNAEGKQNLVWCDSLLYIVCVLHVLLVRRISMGRRELFIFGSPLPDGANTEQPTLPISILIFPAV